ncbi:hypothetical protein N7466_003326 [Penicillium verhagenii]|uniref:uncharacterized protein n=1 Tax=Penicillium verhagenii TaxID=1562060 RepID=UPI0025451B1E|nr:uncharacterized protein N7466_003326 [Penicillium verhagenii]KAJ5936876.1 hypothetical protein N7466_003326 [Penicillium verhagenii]
MMEIEVSHDHLLAHVPMVQRRAEHREGSPNGFTHPGPVRGGHTNLARDIDIVDIHQTQGGANETYTRLPILAILNRRRAKKNMKVASQCLRDLHSLHFFFAEEVHHDLVP